MFVVSVRQCIISQDPYDRVLLRMLLKAFEWFHVCIYFTTVLFVLKAINILLLLLLCSGETAIPKSAKRETVSHAPVGLSYYAVNASSGDAVKSIY